MDRDFWKRLREKVTFKRACLRNHITRERLLFHVKPHRRGSKVSLEDNDAHEGEGKHVRRGWTGLTRKRERENDWDKWSRQCKWNGAQWDHSVHFMDGTISQCERKVFLFFHLNSARQSWNNKLAGKVLRKEKSQSRGYLPARHWH